MKKIFAIILSLCISSSAFANGLTAQPKEVISAAETPTVQGVISSKETVALTEDQAQEMIHVTYSPIPVHSKLKKTYSGYQVTMTSDYPGTLNIQSANITNGTPGVAAAQTVYTSRANMWWSALGGIAGIVLIGLPVLAVISSGNNKAEREGILYTNQIPHATLQKGEAVNFNALTILGQTPQIHISFKDSKTGFEFVKKAR